MNQINEYEFEYFVCIELLNPIFRKFIVYDIKEAENWKNSKKLRSYKKYIADKRCYPGFDLR